ncbi:MAG: phosphoribosyltransferase family protein [bacterium]
MFWIEDFISLVYPRICALCGNSLWRSEDVICQKCEYHLPKTNFHLDPENPVSRLFWGRVRINSAAAFLHFNKGNCTQELIHKLKYKGRKDIGILLGNRYGLYLKQTPPFSDISWIIPVPLHRKKFVSRGYNQSEQFGIGLSSAMGVPVENRELIRNLETETQTKKSRFKRWENVSETFTVRDPQKFEGSHVLLVDDVITTGATIEACIQALAAAPGIRVSIAAIAVAMN